jgi:putative ABC transport system permease protein
VTEQISSFGTDIFEIEIKVPKVAQMSAANAVGQIGGAAITTFKLDDARRVAKLENIDSWYAAIINQQQTTYLDKKKQVIIYGTTAGISQADPKTEISSGQMFTEEDDNGLKQVVVLGSALKEYFFGDEEAIGKNIKIKGQNYRVIGIMKERGMVTFFNFDEIMYIPLQTMQKKLAGIDYLQAAIFKLKDMSKVDTTLAEATDIMRTRHNIKNPDEDDFAVVSIVEFLDILNTVFFAINALLLALTSISLVVGGVGIMNVMYVAVVERTFEIGLKKSVGAKNKSILAQFLFEAIFLTIIGGIVGILLGSLVTKLGEFIASSFGYPMNLSITWWSVAVGGGFSALVGIIFGYYPARKASQMSPMEALRKE